MAAGFKREVLAAPRWPEHAIPEMTGMRGTLLVSSQQAIRDKGLFDDYIRLVPPELEVGLRGMIAAEWVPMNLASAHYAALDGLELSNPEIQEIGEKVISRIQRAYLGTIIRGLGRQVGPVPLFRRIQDGWDKALQGGEAAAYLDGPKDITLSIYKMPLAKYSYIRHGWVGIYRGALGLVSKRAFAKLGPTPDPTVRTDILLSWV